ncbi:MAG: SAM-dependent methyltransferase [Spirochaetia bacterium]|nr:SAM-dependent methyltransferase [Spirochaetia bacterium]
MSMKKNNLSTKKATGSFYTCSSIADYIARWAIKTGNELLLEPSFGDGSFLNASIKYYNNFGNTSPQILGIELQSEPYNSYLAKNNIIHGILSDYLDFWPEKKPNAIIGNPPYISLKNLTNDNQKKIFNIMKKYKLHIPCNGSLWMPFVVHASEMLATNGKLGFVLPYEMTYVRYAFPLWQYLSVNFGSLTICRLYDDFFPEVDVETIIFLADKKGAKCNSVNYNIYNNISDLFNNISMISASIKITEILKMEKPFEQKILSEDTQNLIQGLENNQEIHLLKNECKFKIGYVCGNKKYFHPTITTIQEYKISSQNLLPSILNSKEINSYPHIGVDNANIIPQSFLFYPRLLTEGTKQYIKEGEKMEINKGYKCNSRSPWYITPNIEIPDLILTVFGDIPRLISNSAKFLVSNSLLSGIITDNSISKENIICRWYNSLTLLQIETLVHSLGGGTLVLIPGEIDKIKILKDIPNNIIAKVYNQLNQCLLENGIDATYKLGDKIVLQEIYGLSDENIDKIRNSIENLRNWRIPKRRRKIL